MKTRVTIIGSILIVSAIFFLQEKKEKNIDLLLCNIEALAISESTNIKCLFSGSLDCPISSVKVHQIYY